MKSGVQRSAGSRETDQVEDQIQGAKRTLEFGAHIKRNASMRRAQPLKCEFTRRRGFFMPQIQHQQLFLILIMWLFKS